MKITKIILLILIVIGTSSLLFANTDEELEEQFNNLWSSGNYNDVVKLGMQGVSLALERIDGNLDVLNSNNAELVSTLFESDPQKMIDLVNNNPDENLLSDNVVREAYQNAIGSNPELIQRSPEAFRQFAQQENFQVPSDFSNLEITNFNRFDETFTIKKSDTGNFIKISKNDLRGGQINQDGTITLSNGAKVIDNSNVVRETLGEFRVDAINSNSPAKVSFADKTFSSNEMIVGESLGNNFIQVVNSPIEYMTNDEGLSQRRLTQGKLTFEESTSDIIFSENTELKFLDTVVTDNNLNREEIIQTIKTQKELRYTSSECGSSTNCVQQTINNNGNEIVNIKVGNNNDLEFSTFDNRERFVNVEHVIDESNVKLTNMFESQRLVVNVDNEGAVLESLPPSDESNIEITSYILGPDGEIHSEMITQSDERGKASFIVDPDSLGSQIDLEQFSEQYRDDIEKIINGEIDISQISNYNGNSIVAALNSVGLDSSLAFRKELGKLFEIEAVGTGQGNINLLNALQKEDSLSQITSTNSVQTGFSYPEAYDSAGTNVNTDEILNCNSNGICSVGGNQGYKYEKVTTGIGTLYLASDGNYYDQFGNEINPNTGEKIGESVLKSRGVWIDEDVVTTNTQLYSPTQETESIDWAPSTCSNSNSFNCQIGRYKYKKKTINGDTYFEARDGFFYNENGEEFRRNSNGELEATGGSSSQVDFFRGGVREEEARGNLNTQLTLSTRGDISHEFESIVNRYSGTTRRNLEQLGPEFIDEVNNVAARLGISSNYLIQVMSKESGFNPSIRNRYSGATGLIQFMPDTARGLGTTTSQLAQMSAIDQLEYVEAHIRPYASRVRSSGDVYMTVFYPAAAGKQNSYLLGSSSGSSFQKSVYRQNRALDLNRDGRITKGEAVRWAGLG